MATDATGAPTPLGIPKYNTSVDAPSGLGFNAAMDAIDTLITAKQLPAASGSNKVPVWNGSSWVAQTVPPAAVTPGAAGQVLGMLAGVPAWMGGLSKIADETKGSAAASFDFQSLSQDYAHMLVISYLRKDQAVTTAGTSATFNNDTGSNYSSHVFQAVDTTVSAAQSTTTSFNYGDVTGASAAANRWGMAMWLIPVYASTTGHKVAFGLNYHHNGVSSTPTTKLLGALWFATPAAINRLTISAGTGNFIAGSRVSVYGIG